MGSEESAQDSQPVLQPSIRLFLIKTIIIVVAIIGVLTYIDSLAEQRVSEIRQSFGPVSGRAFWTRVERELDRLADPNAIPPQKREELLRKLNAIAANWTPFLNAIQDGAAKARRDPSPGQKSN